MDRLPKSKLSEIEYVRRLIVSEFESAIEDCRRQNNSNLRIVKLILFGAYAAGEWLDNPLTGSQSSFHFLVVVNDDRCAEDPIWGPLRSRVEYRGADGNLRTPAGLVVVSLSEVNRHLQNGTPFFVDAIVDGLHIFGSDRHISPYIEMSDVERLARSRGYFERLLDSRRPDLGPLVPSPGFAGGSFHDTMKAYRMINDVYRAVICVHSLYCPRHYTLSLLRSLAEDMAPQLSQIWSQSPNRLVACQRRLTAIEHQSDAFNDNCGAEGGEMAICDSADLLLFAEDLKLLARDICDGFLELNA